ncbi:MAG: FtsX-like permease family protein [Lachnospiraceae bacterium]|nr:FtsX-like permease family protein [Lachnospiraceae bacterium]
MKKLNHRYKRNFKNSLAFYICLGFLTCVTVLMYLLFSSAVLCEQQFVNDLFDKNQVEDGQFTTLMPISKEDIGEMQEDYHVSIEKQRFFDTEEKDYTLRLFTFTDKINKALVVKGNAPKEKDEISLSKCFADANHIEIGDKVKLNGKKYRVVGFAERPDYLYMIENQSDSFHRAEEFGIGFVARGEMDDLEDSSFYYSVTYEKDNREAFRKHLDKEYTTLSYMTAETNHRISTPKNTIIQYELITGAILPALLVLVIAVIAVVLGRKVRSEKKHIGTLTALGYRKSEIALHYTWYALIPGIVGEVLGLVISYGLVEPMSKAFFFKLEELPIHYSINPLNILPAMVLPVVCYVITAMWTVFKMLRMNVTDMLSGRSIRGKESHMLVKSNMNFKRKFRIRALFNNFGRTMVAILGILVSGLIMAVGLMMNDSCQNYEDNIIDEIGTFKYEYVLNNLTDDKDNGGEKALSTTFEVKNSENNVMLMGLEDDTRYVNIKTTGGKKADLHGKYYISSMASAIFGVKKGDTFTVMDTTSLKRYKIKIDGIINNKAQSVIYSDRETVEELLDIDEGMYNVIMADQKLELDEDLVNTTIKKQTMKDMIQNVISGMKGLIYLMVIFGAVICVVCIYLMVNMLIEENAVTISMLKVLGYKDREINRITIHIYHVLVPIGIVLALVFGYYITYAYFDYSTATFQAQVPAFISREGLLIFVGGIVLAYGISLGMLSRKVKRVNMSDSLKSIRE